MNELLKIDPESCALLLAIARYAVRQDRHALRDAAEKMTGWNGFLDLARVHHMSPTALWCFENDQAPVPPRIRERLAAEYEQNLCQTVLCASELLEVLRRFAEQGIRAMPIKGVALATSAWRNLGVRACGDLDVLIRREDLERATALMEERGFRQSGAADKNQHQFEFLRSSDGMRIELHWMLDFIYARHGRNPDFEWAWEGHTSTQLNGADIPIMSAEKTLVLLCMHGSKHVWSRLMWVCDVAQLIASSPQLDWYAAEAEARSMGLWKTLALGTLLAHRLLGSPTECPLLHSMQRDSTVASLARHFEENLLRAPGTGPAGRVPYNLKIMDFRDRLRLVLSGAILRPNDLDVAVLPFRGPQLLYYLVRPIRILLDRSAR